MIGAKIGKTMGKGLTYLQNRLTIVNLQVDYEVFVAIHSLGAMPVAPRLEQGNGERLTLQAVDDDGIEVVVVPRYDIHGKKIFQSNEKIYWDNLGLRN